MKLDGEKIKVGYLIKKGAVRKNWTTRYCVLRSDSIAYYKAPNDPPKGVIWLDSETRVTNLDAKKKFSFTLTQPHNTREYWLAAADPKEHNMWMDAIRKVIEERKSGDGVGLRSSTSAALSGAPEASDAGEDSS
tara:strand:- start:103 stop:504 length:402 start_codon:yes stop_codon:yes gene_type:complete